MTKSDYKDIGIKFVVFGICVYLFFIYHNLSMMFFNLLFYKNFYHNLKDFNMDISSLLNVTNELNRSSNRSLPVAYILKNQDFCSGDKHSLAAQKMERKKMGSIIRDDIWSQDIFLSPNSKLLNKYSVQINSLKIHQRQSTSKSLILKFSQCLFNGSIQVSSKSNNKYATSSLGGIQYSWAKTLKLKYFQFSNLLGLNSNHEKNKYTSNMFHKRINLDQIPLFVISNRLGQMVISEPPTDLNVPKHFRSYSSVGNYYSNIYYGFFFTNYKDAQEYLNHIKKAYPMSRNDLKIFACDFKVYYKAINSFDDNIRFKLIPDLIEISNLIKRYRYDRHISFHKEQVFSKDHFKGQPLYMIKNGDINIMSSISQKESHSYNLFALNYKEALEIFNKFNKHQLTNKKQRMNIIIYNLEDFIQDQLKSENTNSSLCLVLPSRDSYLFTKQTQPKATQKLFYLNYLKTLSSISLWSKRIFWSLTSRQPSVYF